MAQPVRIITVCAGNICRSPAAEAAIREAAAETGLAVELDSAGIGPWHIGQPPNPRMQRAASSLGLGVSGRARQIEPADFDRFDLILAMDRQNLEDLRALAPDSSAEAKIHLFRTYDPNATDDEVPDPYYGADQGFVDVVRMVRAAARGLVASLERGSD
ncbi:MAG: low molecular weight phosphotyrosine protein phosphatase [Acidimicrobiia bacterium]|nr:low molecular weight phosphotyrosine protein phosphatase [Acidimicrobiia bacterium]MDH4309475.1 low molecular weight phosphotyrosine protein phosphatase [Acidimicrobiia bacterium]